MQLGEDSTYHLEQMQKLLGETLNSSDTHATVKDAVHKWKTLLHSLAEYDGLSGEALAPIIEELAALSRKQNKEHINWRNAIEVLLRTPLMSEAQLQAAFEEAYFSRNLDAIRMMATCEDINPACNVERLKATLEISDDYKAYSAYANYEPYAREGDSLREKAAYGRINDATGIDVIESSGKNMESLRTRVRSLSSMEKCFKDSIVAALEGGNFYLSHLVLDKTEEIGSEGKLKKVSIRNDRRSIKTVERMYSLTARKAMGGDVSGTMSYADQINFANSDFVFTALQLGPAPQKPKEGIMIIEPGKLPQGAFFNNKDWGNDDGNEPASRVYYGASIPEAIALLAILDDRKGKNKIAKCQTDDQRFALANDYLDYLWNRRELLIPNRLSLRKEPGNGCEV